jgi:TolB protein
MTLRTRRAALTRLFGAAGTAGAMVAGCGAPSLDIGTGLGGGREEGREPRGGSGEPGRSAPTVPGRILYVSDSDIWTWENGKASRLTRDRVSRQPTWSPSGKHIALVKIDISSSEIWVMDANSANSRQLTRNYSTTLTQAHWAFRPVWWPDATRVLYLTDATTRDLVLWQVAFDGRNRAPFLAIPDLEGGLDMPAVAPDGRRLAVVTYRGASGRPQVWSYGLPNGPWRQLTESPEGAYDPVWSPDGARLALTQRSGGKHDVWVMAADGSDPQPVTRDGLSRAPEWSPDGTAIAFISGRSGAFDLWVAQVPGPTVPARTASGEAERREPLAAPDARDLTRGAGLDAVSGLSWTV